MSHYFDFLPVPRFQPTLALSHDGRQIAYVDDTSGQFNIAVRPVLGGPARSLTSYVDSTVRRVVWHPDGTSLVFLADHGGDEYTQLYLVDVAGGAVRALAESRGVQYAAALGDPFSPNGRLLAFTGNDRAAGDQDVLIRDLASGVVRRVYAGGGRVFAGFWSPDGAHLTAAHWIEGNSDHVAYLVPADGGVARRLSPEGVVATYALGPWLPDGSGFLVLSNFDREFAGLAVMRARDGELTWLARPDREIEEVALSGDGRVLVWNANVDGASRLHARDLTTGLDLALPELPAGVASELAVTADGRFVAIRMSTPTRPWNIAVIDLASGRLRWLTDARPLGADPARMVEPTVISYPSRDGRQIPAYLYRPAGATGPMGAVLAIHGGPAYQKRPVYEYEGLVQYLVSRGVAVLAPNARGSTGYGKSYKMLTHRDWGGGDLDDFAGAAEYLRRQDWVDSHRIGLYGSSYGGFAVLSCLSRLPEYDWAAGVDMCGPANLLTFTRAASPTWRSKVAALVGDPDADAELLSSRSPITYADRIRAPLFVIQGANDARVPKGESDQIVRRLRARGVDVRYDVYPDEGHTFSKRENQARARSDAAEFLLAHLSGPDPR